MSVLSGRVRQVSLSVADVEQAVVFYRDVLGLRLVAQFGLLAFFGLDGVRLAVSRPEGAPASNSVLYFAVEDLHETRSTLESSGVEFVDEPHMVFDDSSGVFGDPGEAEWMTFFRDPEGNLLALSARVART